MFPLFPSLVTLTFTSSLPIQRPGAAHPLRTHLPDGAQQPIGGGVRRDKTTSLGDGAGISDEALHTPPPAASGRRGGHGQGQCSSLVHSTPTDFVFLLGRLSPPSSDQFCGSSVGILKRACERARFYWYQINNIALILEHLCAAHQTKHSEVPRVRSR